VARTRRLRATLPSSEDLWNHEVLSAGTTASPVQSRDCGVLEICISRVGQERSVSGRTLLGADARRHRSVRVNLLSELMRETKPDNIDISRRAL
jgi:hypothetical protein